MVQFVRIHPSPLVGHGQPSIAEQSLDVGAGGWRGEVAPGQPQEGPPVGVLLAGVRLVPLPEPAGR